jgi:hypothetical protein
MLLYINSKFYVLQGDRRREARKGGGAGSAATHFHSSVGA